MLINSAPLKRRCRHCGACGALGDGAGGVVGPYPVIPGMWGASHVLHHLVSQSSHPITLSRLSTAVESFPGVLCRFSLNILLVCNTRMNFVMDTAAPDDYLQYILCCLYSHVKPGNEAKHDIGSTGTHHDRVGEMSRWDLAIGKHYASDCLVVILESSRSLTQG